MSTPATKANEADASKAKEAATQQTDDMGYGDEAANTNDTKGSGNGTIVERVNEALTKYTNDKGELVIPDDIKDEAFRHAIVAEKRFRDTQGSYTKERQKTKALEVENTVLKTKATDAVTVQLTKEQEEELEELKFSNPEAWRKKMNTHESNARQKQQEELEKEVKEKTTSTLAEEELESRKSQLDQFLKDHEGFKLDDDIIANDIPPRITKKLENGTITFEQFLKECYDYSKTGKVIKQETTPNMANLSKVGGGDRPDQNAQREDAIVSYNKEVY